MVFVLRSLFWLRRRQRTWRLKSHPIEKIEVDECAICFQSPPILPTSLPCNHGPFCGHCLVRYWWSQGLPLEGIACPLCRANAHCLCAPKGTMARGLDLRGRLVGLAISAYNALVRFHPWINVAKAIFVLGFAVSATTYFYESFTNFFYRNWVPSMLIVLIASYMRRHYRPESLAVRIILEGW